MCVHECVVVVRSESLSFSLSSLFRLFVVLILYRTVDRSILHQKHALRMMIPICCKVAKLHPTVPIPQFFLGQALQVRPDGDSPLSSPLRSVALVACSFVLCIGLLLFVLVRLNLTLLHLLRVHSTAEKPKKPRVCSRSARSWRMVWPSTGISWGQFSTNSSRSTSPKWLSSV
jgi:hypothetical protein